MNSNNLHANDIAQDKISSIASQQVSFIGSVLKKVHAFFNRSELQKAQAKYAQKRQRQQSVAYQRDIVNSLPVEDKLSMGMYCLMD
ncbi:MAG: hypothetical protein GY815_15610 [Gammaproteobacteria bacterium]|nr:hypothetical protein [Gammaproteobacteria bacterium]